MAYAGRADARGTCRNRANRRLCSQEQGLVLYGQTAYTSIWKQTGCLNMNEILLLALLCCNDPSQNVQTFPVQSRKEFEWRRRHYEIPPYVPYTLGYGPYIENGHP